MKIIYGLNKFKRLAHPVVALGVFDGVHFGHRKILEAAVKKSALIKGTSIALTFSPHPQKKESLYSLEHRLRLIAELGIEVCIVIKFNRSFAAISSQDFIQKILARKLKADFVYVGRNFRFGRHARGDWRLLVKESRRNNFKVRIFDVLKSSGNAISSTLIRRLIKASKIKAAQSLLGRRVSVLGTVVKGSRLGRLLGFPTANIQAHHEVIPPSGIYAVEIVLFSKKYKGVCYIGPRPTVTPKSKDKRIEVHIFNFHKNIYGLVLEIQFIKLIRKDRKFASLKALSAQIQKDIALCRKIL